MTGGTLSFARLTGHLARADLAHIGREALMVFFILLPVLLAVLLRMALPGMERMLAARFDIALAGFHPMIMGVFVGMAPGLIGGTYGLLLVDERDARTLAAIRTTPVGLPRYLTARLILPVLLCVATTVLAYPLAGAAPLPTATVALIAVSAACLAPAAALAVLAFSADKLMGLVIFRLVNTAQALPAVAFLAPPEWSRLGGVLPAYWPMQALWQAAGAPADAPILTLLPVLAVAPVVGAVLTVFFYRVAVRRVA